MPELVRTTMAHGAEGLEPALLIKTSSLSLKYCVRLQKLQLVFVRFPGERIGYGVKIDDDPDHSGVVWSVIEDEDEKAALNAVNETSRCVVFLFNELAISVAWANVSISLAGTEAASWLEKCAVTGDSSSDFRSEMATRLDAFIGGKSRDDVCALLPTPVAKWIEVRSHYLTNRLTRSFVSVFEMDEGRQQEEMGLWLIDSLDPSGAVKNPIVHHKTKSRELSDLLLSYKYGAFLFESKSLSVFSQRNLPTRKKLAKLLEKHILKAESQLTGGIRGLRAGYRVTDVSGADLEVEREKPVHAIILVPDLALLSDAQAFGGEFLRGFSQKTGSFLHILDPTELLRTVQAAEVLESHGKMVTRMVCFDSYLIERWKRAVELKTPNFDFLLRIA